MGGCSGSDSFSTSFSSSSSWNNKDSTSSLSWFSSSSSSPKKEAQATHESIGTTAPSPVAASPDMRFWGNLALASSGAVALFLAVRNYTPPRTTTAVVKLQVALRGTAMTKLLQKDLNEIAEKVEASNRRWYKFILTETLSSLRRHKDCCISPRLSVDEKDRVGSWKEHFNKISIDERSKFDEETLSNLEGIKRKKSYSKKTDGNRNEYIVGVCCFLSWRRTKRHKKKVHLLTIEAWNPLRPYPISKTRVIPGEIEKPDWALDGIPKIEPGSDLQKIVEIKTPEQIERMRETCQIAREVLDAVARVIKPGITTDEIDRVVHVETIARASYQRFSYWSREPG